MIQDYSKSSAKWVPIKPGEYLYGVHIKDEKSKERLDTHLYKPITIKSILLGKTIVLDPGHGGRTSGAVNSKLGIIEKYANNTLTRKIADKLTEAGAKVVFTRKPEKDIYVSLEDRANIANNAKADLFISIHHDGNANKNVSGISTHYSTYRPGIDTSNTYVMYKGKRYQYVREIKNWDGITSAIVYLDEGKEVTRSMDDLKVYDNETPTLEAIESNKFAEYLFDSIYSLGFSTSSYKRDGNFYVTRWTNMPSVLLEAGYISNDTEALRVTDPVFEMKIAEKVVQAIIKFFM
ncbi:MAG: N-acetylmuramoyl-L-alanine amidase [Tissierellia bacterium]|nr:N-acetylmuramoyl-L-alanine amidase [Tissierellia bacterium]